MDLREYGSTILRLGLFQTENVNRIVNEKQNSTLDCKIACDTSKDKKLPFMKIIFAKTWPIFIQLLPFPVFSCESGAQLPNCGGGFASFQRKSSQILDISCGAPATWVTNAYL